MSRRRNVLRLDSHSYGIVQVAILPDGVVELSVGSQMKTVTLTPFEARTVSEALSAAAARVAMPPPVGED